MTINKYSTQFIDDIDISAVKKSLTSEYITQGTYNKIFEQNLSKYTKSKYSLVLNSATSALHVACLSLNLKKNDIVWTSVNSFVASSNCALYCGAKVDFIDIDTNTFNISIEFLKQKLKKAKKNKSLPKIVVVVHIGGNPCDMKEIKNLSKKYNFKVIEDASHALGASYKNSLIGSCKYSDISIFSYYPVKMITTGEGGSLHTNNKNIFKKASMLRSHGITKNVRSPTTKKFENWYYEQIYLGFNYRMSDINASLGISQLKKLDKFLRKRNLLANEYNKLFDSNKYVNYQKIEKNNLSSYHLYILMINENSEVNNYQLMKYLSKFKIGTQLHYLPIHLQPYYKKLGFRKGDYLNAERYSQKALSIPLNFHMSLKDIRFISNKINKYFGI